MASHTRKLDAVRVLAANSKLHAEINGHEPYFTLTAAGARALIAYFAEHRIEFSRVGSNCGFDHGVHTDALRSFFAGEMGIKLRGTKTVGSQNSSDTEAIHKLLGATSRGFNLYGTDKVAIDMVALNALAEPKTHKR